MADEDKENLPVEPQLKRAYLSLSLPKDRFSFSVDDKDLEEAMKKYSVKTLRSITSRLLKTLRTGLKQSAIQPKYHLMFSSLMIQLFSVILLSDDPTVLCDTLCFILVNYEHKLSQPQRDSGTLLSHVALPTVWTASSTICKEENSSGTGCIALCFTKSSK